MEKVSRLERAEKDLRFFVEYYFEEYLECEHAPYHVEDYKSFPGKVDKRTREASAEPRDHAKTSRSLFKKAWLILFKKKKYILCVSDSTGQALQENMNLIFELKYNERILEDFGDVIPKHSERDTQSDFITRDGIRVQAVGSGKRLRGLRHRAKRPDIIFIDDLENDINVRSEAQRKYLWDWLNGTILPMLDKKVGDLFYSGTILHMFSVLNRCLKEKKTWSSNRLAAMDEDGNVLWPGKFNKALLEEIKEDMGTFQFQREMMNDPVSDDEVVFQLDWLGRYSHMPAFNKFDDVVGGIDLKHKEKTKGDWFAFVVMGILDGKKYLIDVFRTRGTNKKQVRGVLERCRQYRVRKVLVEKNGLQELLYDVIKDEGKKLKVDTFFEGVDNTTDKYARILRLQAPAERGDFLIPEEAAWLNDFLNEYLYFPQTKHEDILDAWEMSNRDMIGATRAAGVL